ncbi:hypothetical protein [Streptodolium elevatio]|uniref:Lipoprotein n=1 Tax=Streptodolium elevatio TaxID=3157996 RepID=A0ABV3DI35_9ACTN
MPMILVALAGLTTACQKDGSDSLLGEKPGFSAEAQPSDKAPDTSSDKPSGKASDKPSGGASDGPAKGDTPRGGLATTEQLTAVLLDDGEIGGDYKVERTNRPLEEDNSIGKADDPRCQVLLDHPVGDKPPPFASREYTPDSLATGPLPDITFLLMSKPHAEHLQWLADLQESYQKCEHFNALIEGKTYEVETGMEDYEMYGLDSFEYRMTITTDAGNVEVLFVYIIEGDTMIAVNAVNAAGAGEPEAPIDLIQAQIGNLRELAD